MDCTEMEKLNTSIPSLKQSVCYHLKYSLGLEAGEASKGDQFWALALAVWPSGPASYPSVPGSYPIRLSCPA